MTTLSAETRMEYCSPILIKLIIINCLFVLCASQSFDFFYFVQQWPPALCDQKRSCCYPTTGKPELDFGIHGLWPTYNNGSYPSSCDRTSLYDETEIEDLISSMQENWPTLACPTNNGTKFWSHEWDKHGTCSLSTLDEHSYFEAALKNSHYHGVSNFRDESPGYYHEVLPVGFDV